MDPHNLPQFPVQHEEVRREKNERLPRLGEALSILFDFSTGLALANLFVAGFLTPCFAVSALALVVEAPVLFGVFGLLIVISNMSDLEQAAHNAYEEGRLGATWQSGRLGTSAIIVGPGLGVALGTGFALAFVHLFGYLQVLGRPIQGLLDNLFVGALIGALVGMVGGGGLTLAGGTPDWKAGRLFTALGRTIPVLLRTFIPNRTGEIHLKGKPWLEGIVWFGFVGGPIVWFLW